NRLVQVLQFRQIYLPTTGSTDPDFKWLRGFVPALFNRYNFFRIIFAVTSRQFRPCEKNFGTAKENRQYKEPNGFLSYAIVHHAFPFLLVTPLPGNQTFLS